MDLRLDRPHSKCTRCGEQNALPLLEIEPRFSGLPVHILVTILTEINSWEVLTFILWSF
jgi:hypothetical protein